MILVLTSLFFLLGGSDAQSYTCRSCGSFTNTTVPGGDQPTNGFYIVEMVRDANDCAVAVFKCVVFDPRCVATSYVNDASGNRLMTYPASNTTSQGGNMTCTVLSTGAGWRYNGVVASFRCNFNCESDGGVGAGDVTFADETVEPTEPATTTAQPTTPTTTTTAKPTTTTVKPTTTTVKPTTTTVKPTTTTVKPAATTLKPTTKKDNCKPNYGGGNNNYGGSNIYVGSARRGYY
ncbi:hypothetical protein B9Z55_021727 [Caenorhabditis nigoni]|uniref:C6 domain-containing protein n=1 Tax=Caenorhabditis nigoni TaxID=1611254 RepID=A0A2G5TT90_9PELO|nr:hypothetical protein B9Z55_021727 [Caenorhabditis nigoni]